MSGSKDFRQLLRRCRDLGCEIGVTRGEHIKITCPNGAVVITASTASDWRSIKNLRASLRRNGVRV